MKSTSLYILALHAIILVINLLTYRLFPRMRKASLGIYLVLMPIGFLFWTELEAWLVAVLVCTGLSVILYHGNRVTADG